LFPFFVHFEVLVPLPRWNGKELHLIMIPECGRDTVNT